jgi:archaea-specific RecJ-like exonuclease
MENINIGDITEKKAGSEYYVIAKVKGIRQTSGPTVFELKDNTGHIKATAFIRAGERALPNLMIGDNIQAKVQVKKRMNDIELEILSFEKINQEIIKEINLQDKPFLIKSDNLEKLRGLFVDAATIIKKAAEESRPIIIRHHDDADGYSAGLALEKAIKPIIEETNEKAYHYISRSSSRSPYYDYTDSLRDLNSFMISRNKENPPLVILCDLGSNMQSMKAIKRLKIYGFEFIIVDHHRFDEGNKEEALVFLNPQVLGMGSDLNAGALACELALFINPDINVKHLPALSGTADKSGGEDFERYLQVSGYDTDYLKDWTLAIDHETYYLRFQESSELLEDLFFPSENNSDIVRSVKPLLEREFEQVKLSARKNVAIKKIGKLNVLMIDKKEAASYGDYASSKITRITHELESGPRITMACTDDSISFRADEAGNFSVVRLLEILKEKHPYAMLDGGGHDYAGSINFTSGSKDEIMASILDYISHIE